MKRIISICFIFLAFQTGNLFSQNSQSVEVRVIDVGAGLSCLIKLPNNKFMVYDAGNEQASVVKELKKFLKNEKNIELMVLSHTDADHWGAAKYIVDSLNVNKILKTDYRMNKKSETYKTALNAINQHSSIDILELNNYKPGNLLYNEDGVKIYFIAGFKELPEEWSELEASEANNSVSIVMKLEYQNQSILFCGDAIGKERNFSSGRCSNNLECIATEAYMLEHSRDLLQSTVIIAPHHGGDNASCQDFINAVKPKFVVFSCGSKHKHPKSVTAQRYINSGVRLKNIYRTDYFDTAEIQSGTLPCNEEWMHKRNGNHLDNVTDDVQILIKNSNTTVKYLY